MRDFFNPKSFLKGNRRVAGFTPLESSPRLAAEPRVRDLMPRANSLTGFTIIETIIVIAIIAIIAVVSLFNLVGYKNRAELDSAVRQVSALLREAQSRSAVYESGKTWGVHFENATATAPFYALFYSPYSSSTVVKYYAFPNLVKYATSSLGIGSSTEITFTPLSGLPSASTSLVFVLSVGGSVTTSSAVVVSGSGLIRY